MFSPSINEVKISQSFYLADALWLPSWGIHAFPKDNSVIANIFDMGKAIDMVENILGTGIKINSWYRPLKYNEHIGGSKRSWHITGGAVDFYVPGLNADDARDKLKPYLLEIGIRMENLPRSRWIHIDNKPVGKKRFFRP